MTDNKVPKLRVSRAEAYEKILKRINRGKELFETQISYAQELKDLKRETGKWIDYNKTLFQTLFDKTPSAVSTHGMIFGTLTNQTLVSEIQEHKNDISHWIKGLESVYESLELYEELPSNTQQTANRDTMNNANKKIFIGHGGSHVWRELKDFIEDTLGLDCVEFNSVSPAGKSTVDRLKEMLAESCMAFLIMTGEDEQPDGKLRARSNVIHEVGLFQGKLGFERAVILLEEGCEGFSNIHGVTHIPFPKGSIEVTYGSILKVLKRESIT